MGYLDTNYSYSVRPKTSYPKKLISYLISRFEIKENSNCLIWVVVQEILV